MDQGPNLNLNAGVEPGLRFACVLDGIGGCSERSWTGVRDWTPAEGLLWVHLERDAPEAIHWLRNESGIDPLIADTLLAEDSRPRVEAVEDALLLILRGINIEEKTCHELVPIHIWTDHSRIVTLRDREHTLSALRDIRLALQLGRGPRAVGPLLARITEKIERDLEPAVDTLEEQVERLEDQVLAGGAEDLRRDLAAVRRQAIHLRRYLGPQREALSVLRAEETTLLDKRDRMRVRCVIDQLARHIEDLDALRDRTTIMHEDLTMLIAERTAKTTHRLTAIAGLLLPPSLVAGMLGANIGGIPGQDDPYAFLQLIALIVGLLSFQFFLLRRIRWI